MTPEEYRQNQQSIQQLKAAVAAMDAHNEEAMKRTIQIGFQKAVAEGHLAQYVLTLNLSYTP